MKDWQTFMAACVALIGGSLAYKGAMAKVDFDRSVHQRTVDNMELGIYLRLRSTLSFVRSFSAASVRKLKTHLAPGETELKVMDLDPVMKFDVDEAWSNLQIFPASIAKDIASMKVNLDAFYMAIEASKSVTWKKRWGTEPSLEAKQLFELCERLVTMCDKVGNSLADEIGEY